MKKKHKLYFCQKQKTEGANEEEHVLIRAEPCFFPSIFIFGQAEEMFFLALGDFCSAEFEEKWNLRRTEAKRREHILLRAMGRSKLDLYFCISSAQFSQLRSTEIALKMSFFLWVSQFRTQLSSDSVGLGCKTRSLIVGGLDRRETQRS